MDRLNLFAPEFRKNPYPHYAALRRSAPVAQIDPGGLWAVSRYDDVMATLKDTTRFSSQGLRAATNQPWLGHNPLGDSMLLMDPPQHTQIRGLVTGAFTTRVIPRIEPLAREVTRGFVARARAGGEIDVCAALSSLLPAAVITNLLGLDPALHERIQVWTSDLVAVHPGTPLEVQARIRASIAELEHCLLEVFADRRREKRDDLVSDLLVAEIDGQHLTETNLVSFLFLLVSAGYETTTNLLTNALRVLSDRPDLLARLRAEPAAIPAFIEEVLRFDPPVQATARLTREDSQIAEVAIPAGSFVLLLLGSACRDERCVENPDHFDMDRKQRGSLPFGYGIHFCLGAALARAEARIAMEELLPHVRGMRVTREPTWNESLTVRGATTCLMEFEPA
jgi:cytochrome P450